MNDNEELSSAMEDAATEYQHMVETLPDEYRNLFQSCHNEQIFLTDLDGIKRLKFGKGISHTRHLPRIQTFVQSVQPLFAALDVFCQVDPIHFATVWGGIRVLVQACEDEPFCINVLIHC